MKVKPMEMMQHDESCISNAPPIHDSSDAGACHAQRTGKCCRARARDCSCSAAAQQLPPTCPTEQPNGSCQAAVEQLPKCGSCRAAVGQLSGSCETPRYVDILAGLRRGRVAGGRRTILNRCVILYARHSCKSIHFPHRDRSFS
jgi:hypothetical protein